jgi:predicted transcriptional regulator
MLRAIAVSARAGASRPFLRDFQHDATGTAAACSGSPEGPRMALALKKNYGHTLSMATTSVRSTYSLDVQTVERIEQLARRWNVSKSEVLRRAVKMADEQSAVSDRLAALKELQESMQMTPEKEAAWVAEIRAERDAHVMAWEKP